MPSKLPPSPSLESLRKQAKQLFKSVRRDQPDAVERAISALGVRSEALSLRDAQRVIAHEHGFSSWLELRREVEARLASRVEAGEDAASRVDRFLDLACLTYSTEEGPERLREAEGLLARHSELADASIFAAATLGDAERVARFLRSEPALTRRAGGPRGWVPLLYLCYSRVQQKGALRTARLLLEHGADPNAHYFWPPEGLVNKYTALTGVFGLGESGPSRQPPHPERDALARLLLEAGADPDDGQALYQCHFTEDDDFLEILFEYGLPVPWWLLPVAARQGYRSRVGLLLARGADPNAIDRWRGTSALENALLGGYREIAEDLLRAGASPVTLDAAGKFQAAVRAGDVDGARELVREHPEFLEEPRFLLGAAEVGNLGAVRLLLDLGCSPNLRPENGSTALHAAAWNDDRAIAEELLARGADPTLVESAHNGTPASHAHYAGHRELAKFFMSGSEDLVALVHFGHLERLRELVPRNPEGVQRGDGAGRSLLHYVDVDAPNAAEIVRLLLDSGAPSDARVGEGETPLERFLRLGAEDLADLLIERGASE